MATRKNIDILSILNDIKNKSYFDVHVRFTYPIRLHGRIPFRVHSEGDDMLVFQVLAKDETQAEELVFDYLNSLDEENNE